MTSATAVAFTRDTFQSTCHIRGMTPHKRTARTDRNISIHMPHTWHDLRLPVHRGTRFHFNPHATYVA